MSEAYALDPFGPSANPAAYVPSAAIEQARQALEASLASGRVAGVIGPPGLGKTLLLHLVAAHHTQGRVAYVPFSSLEADELFSWIGTLLGMPAGVTREALLAEIREPVLGEVLLLVDDAHTLSNDAAKALASLAIDGGERLRVALAMLDGEPARRVHEHFRPRIDLIELDEGLSLHEVRDFIEARLAYAGARPGLVEAFDGPTIERMHRESGGNPRLLNQSAMDVVRRAADRDIPRLHEIELSDVAENAGPPPKAIHDRRRNRDRVGHDAMAAYRVAREQSGGATGLPAAGTSSVPRARQGDASNAPRARQGDASSAPSARQGDAPSAPRVQQGHAPSAPQRAATATPGHEPAAPTPERRNVPPRPSSAGAPERSGGRGTLLVLFRWLAFGMGVGVTVMWWAGREDLFHREGVATHETELIRPEQVVRDRRLKQLPPATETPATAPPAPTAAPEVAVALPRVEERALDARAALERLDPSTPAPARELPAPPQAKPPGPIAVVTPAPGKPETEVAGTRGAEPGTPEIGVPESETPETGSTEATAGTVAMESAFRDPLAPDPAAETIAVSINATPWAFIEIDGRDVGETPLAGLRVTPGVHHFLARMPDGSVREKAVHVGPNENRITFE